MSKNTPLRYNIYEANASTCLTDAQKEKFKLYCKFNNKSMSQMIRELINVELEKFKEEDLIRVKQHKLF